MSDKERAGSLSKDCFGIGFITLRGTKGRWEGSRREDLRFNEA